MSPGTVTPAQRAVGIASVAAFTFVLGVIGFATAGVSGAAEVTYRTLQLFLLDYQAPPEQDVPTALDVARFVAPAVTLALTADAIAAIATYVREGSSGLRTPRDHTIVCGLGRTGATLATSLRRPRREQVVGITSAGHDERLRTCRRSGVHVMTGDATDPSVLRRAGTRRARRVVIACASDTVNSDVLAAVLKARSATDRSLDAHVQIIDRHLARMLGETIDPRTPIGTSSVRLHLLDLTQAATQAMCKVAPPAVGGRYVIIGFGTLGQALAARLLDTTQGQAEIMAVDRTADRKARAFNAREKRRNAAVEACELEFEHEDFESGRFLRCEVDAVYVCTHDDAVGLATAVHLRKLRDAPVVLRVAIRKGGFAEAIRARDDLNIGIVGMDDVAEVALANALGKADLT